MIGSQTVLIIGFVWPEPNSSAAGTRMLQLIQLFLDQNWSVSFASTASESDYSYPLDHLQVQTYSISLNSSSFDVFLKNLNPDLVLYDRFMTEEQFGWRVSQVLPLALTVLDMEDLHCLRRARQRAIKEHVSIELNSLLQDECAKREIASILRCDLTLVISEFEFGVLGELFNIDASLLHYLPLFADPLSIESQQLLPPFSHRKDFMFIGNFLHEPNKDAVLYLKQVIWPAIRRRMPQAILHVYGAYPNQQVLQLNNLKDGFLVHGRIEDATVAYHEARILLCPLRFGAGIKGKLIDAMQYGSPSVTTQIGSEGICGALAWNGLVSDDPEEIASGAFALYNDELAWNVAVQNGFQILSQRFDKYIFANDFAGKLIHIMGNLPQHRANNFTGAMLRHHTMRSTEYLSRWIEEKNKT